MIITIDTDSAVPSYEQIRAQITAMVNSGLLPAGTRLPAVRQLAQDLGLSPGTVAKAYQQLDDSGVTKAQRRRGTVVQDRATTSEASRLQSLRAAAATYADTARILNISESQAIALAAQAIGDAGAARS